MMDQAGDFSRGQGKESSDGGYWWRKIARTNLKGKKMLGGRIILQSAIFFWLFLGGVVFVISWASCGSPIAEGPIATTGPLFDYRTIEKGTHLCGANTTGWVRLPGIPKGPGPYAKARRIRLVIAPATSDYQVLRIGMDFANCRSCGFSYARKVIVFWKRAPTERQVLNTAAH